MKSVLIIGGDMRFVSTANMFCKSGFDVSVFGMKKSLEFDGRVFFPDSITEGAKNCEFAILPLPSSKDGITVFAPFSQEEIYLDEVFEALGPKSVFCAMPGPEVKKSAEKFGVTLKDYYQSEHLNILNCIPTGEGAICAAIENTPFTLFGSKILVLGFGRVGKYLVKMLLPFGAEVFAEARNEADLAWITALGCGCVPLYKLDELISEFDVIFNTVPARLLSNQRLKALKKDCAIIDLASSPFGADIDFCREKRIRYVRASSLPGKVAPHFAGKIIKEAVCNMLSEEGYKNEI